MEPDTQNTPLHNKRVGNRTTPRKINANIQAALYRAGPRHAAGAQLVRAPRARQTWKKKTLQNNSKRLVRQIMDLSKLRLACVLLALLALGACVQVSASDVVGSDATPFNVKPDGQTKTVEFGLVSRPGRAASNTESCA